MIGDIIADPIGFLGNLISGIKAGLSQFVGNIAGHLQQGLMGWLTGALGGAGIELPKSFDIKSIFTLVLQVLGLTYANIRQRVVKQVGEKVVQKLEQTVDIFKVLVTEGIGGLWRFVQDRLGDLYDTVVGGIKDFIIEKVIKAGITWLIAFMNPAAAFIKACKAIYDIIMFLIERGSEIMAFVNSVLDSIAAVAKGNIGAMAAKIEDALAKALPLLISFLASLLGLGGISEKVRSLIQKVQAPINKAIDFVIQGAVKAAKKLFGKPAKWVKGKVDAAKAKLRGGDDSPEGKQQRLDGAMEAALSVTSRFSGKFVGGRVLSALLTPIRLRYGLTRLAPVLEGDTWYVEGAINPTDKKSTGAKGKDGEGDDKKPEGDDGDKASQLEPKAKRVEQGVGASRDQLKDGEVQKALKDNGRLKGELEEEVRQVDADLKDVRKDIPSAIELGDEGLIGELLTKLDALLRRIEDVQTKLKALKPGAATEDSKPATMRFQVQWGSNDKKNGRTYSHVENSTSPPGVMVAAAVAGLDAAHAKVQERSAKEASRGALEAQKQWVRDRPPEGMGMEGHSKSEYFEYDFSDARVDVENIRGHNLKE